VQQVIDPTFPLIDLHRHLDGNVLLETILDIGHQYGLQLPAWEVETFRPYVQVTEPQPGVMAFISKFRWMTEILVNYQACYRIAYENVIDAQREGLDYVELRFSPWFMAEPHQLDPTGVVEAVTDGVRTAAQNSGMMVNLIGILSRTYGPSIAWKELNALLEYRDRLIAMDLAGDEANCPGTLFVEHLERARQAGWWITVHAGEAAGPESIWQAIQELGASRIGHAVRAVDDIGLMDKMLEMRIGIEANLTSNVQTSTVPDYASHPIKRFIKHGLLATINTDDPGISGIDIKYEYLVAAPAAGLTPEEIRTTQRNAFEVAFLTSEERVALLAKKRPMAPA